MKKQSISSGAMKLSKYSSNLRPGVRHVCLVAVATVTSIVLMACAAPAGPSDVEVVATLKASFKEKGSVKLDRLEQSELQAQCSAYAEGTGRELPNELKAKLEKAAIDAIQYPADGQYLGDHKLGERIAQSGVGQQFSDAPGTVGGGNCYACHQMTNAEVSYGNIGPSLYNYGKLRGNSEPMVKYTWARLWNSHAFNACNNMPRFGAAGILSGEQLKHVMALLLDPASPVNQ